MIDADQQAPLAFRGEPVHVDLRDVDRQPTGHAAIALRAEHDAGLRAIQRIMRGAA